MGLRVVYVRRMNIVVDVIRETVRIKIGVKIENVLSKEILRIAFYVKVIARKDFFLRLSHWALPCMQKDLV